MISITAIIKFDKQDMLGNYMYDFVENYKHAVRQCVKGQIKLVGVFKQYCTLVDYQQEIFDQIIVDNTDRSVDDIVFDVIQSTSSSHVVMFDSHTYIARDYFKVAVKYLKTHNGCRMLTPCITSIKDLKQGGLIKETFTNGVPAINRDNAVGRMLMNYDFVRAALFPNGIVVDKKLVSWSKEVWKDDETTYRLPFSSVYIAYAMLELITARGNSFWTKRNHYAHNGAVGGHDFKIFVDRDITEDWDQFSNEQMDVPGEFYNFFKEIAYAGLMLEKHTPKHCADELIRDYNDSIALAQLTYVDFMKLKPVAITDKIRALIHYNYNNVDDQTLLNQIKTVIAENE